MVDDPDRPRPRDDLDTEVVILAAAWQAKRMEIAAFLDSRPGWKLDQSQAFVTVRFDRASDAAALREMLSDALPRS